LQFRVDHWASFISPPAFIFIAFSLADINSYADYFRHDW
jgi:hypothetical protein